MSVNSVLPWNSSLWNSLLDNPANLPHALLLAGPGGVGKSSFAETMAARLLCEQPQGTWACGECDACRWQAGGNHPDFRKITLEVDDTEGDEASTKASTKKSGTATQIKIHQIRALEDFVFVGSHRHGNRVVIVDPADAMNGAAANSLLKILEEPPPFVYFLMVSSKWRSLLPTLRSRCRKVLFGIPEVRRAITWLQQAGVKDPEVELGLAGGAPLRALARSERGVKDCTGQILAPLSRLPIDPLALAAHWEAQLKANPELNLESLVDIVQKWLHDLIRARASLPPRYLTREIETLSRLAATADPTRLNRCHDSLLKVRATARHPLNTLLFLEDMAARCAVALTTTRH